MHKILGAAAGLFGEPVQCAATAKPEIVLAAIAEAYDKRHKLNKPNRVACINIKRPQNIGQLYLDDPLRYLPETFLVAAGLASAEPDSAPESNWSEEPTADDVEQEPDPGPQPDSSIGVPIGPGKPTPAEAWKAVIGQLQFDMPKAAFDTWVRPSRLVRFEGNRFVIYASTLGVQWLESRLLSTVTRLLIGICNQSVAVVFTDVCAQTSRSDT